MGVSCMATNCACSYCLKEDVEQYQGNIIFKPIVTNIISENDNLSEEEKRILENWENLLKLAEEKRVIIADKFKDMLDKTGAGVLFNPTLERAIISFIIYFFEQIIIYSNGKIETFNIEDFKLTNFIKIDIKKKESNDIIKFNQEFIDNLKTNYNFDMDKIGELVEIKNTIINFLSTIGETKDFLEKQYETFRKYLCNFKCFSKNFRLVSKLTDSIDGIKFIINFFIEITSSLNSAIKQLSNPKKINLFYKIAKDAVEKDIKDPKKLVIAYSLGVNCEYPEKWEENMVYKEVLKY